MLIDDDHNDNYFHEREIKKVSLSTTVITKDSGTGALEYLKSIARTKNLQPDLIFLDINMPCMNGWEFLQEYIKFDNELQNGVLIVMLSTSGNIEDIEKAKTFGIVSDYIIKPLTKEKMEALIMKYFI
jgi:response regulator of citrate/malate metabolism